MALSIKTLRCKVTVKAAAKQPALHRPDKAARPSLTFAQPVGQASAQTPPAPSQTATEDRAPAASGKPIASARQADPKQVANRVYELMMEEVRLARMRGQR